jgi:stage V sporulation protein B
MEGKDRAMEEINFLKNIFFRFSKADFSGTGGNLMKNSSYQLAQSLVLKFGSLLFTIIIARMLLPDIMGLYNLALVTIILFFSFSDLGISRALITFGAQLLGEKKLSKTKGYVKILFRWKLYLGLISSVILLSSSYFISNFYYNKPIFYALLAGGVYIPLVSLVGFIEQMFKATENFKIPLIKEIIFQTSRLILVPISIFLFLRIGLSNQGVVFITILIISITYLIPLLFLVVTAKKKISFLKVKAKNLNKKEILDLKRFITPLSVTVMAGMFFGYIDTLMLGYFIEETRFIAYYGAAFSLVGGAITILASMTTSLMPVFARKSGKALESIFRKARDLTLIISILAGIFTWLLAYYIIRITYGIDYLPAVPILKGFSILIILIPILGFYVGYFTSQKKTKELAWLIIGSAILNVIFNFVGITYGLRVSGEIGGVLGAVGATIMSKVMYFIGLIILRKRQFT